MPVNPCSENGQPGFKWGDSGKCYLYTRGDAKSMGEAKRKATIQGIATGEYKQKSDFDEQELENLFKSLKEWFKERWVDISRPKPGGGFEPCGRSDASSGKYPKCVPASRAARMTPEEIASAVRRKRRAESTQQRDGKKPIYVTTEKAAVPTNPALYARVKAEAKAKFDVYPSAYANAWLVREYKRRGGGYRTTTKSEDLDFLKEEEMINGYPAATQDITINLKNRQYCIDVANYGPLNPGIENTEYWQAKADQFNTNIEQAKSALCRNCAAFIQTSKMKEAIAEGLGGEPEAYAVIEVANLGYCDIFEFKCAGSRTCDAWVAGGPVTDADMKGDEID